MRIGLDLRIYGSAFTGIGRYTFELLNHFLILNKKLKNPHELFLFFNNPQYENFQIKDPHVHKVLADIKHYSWKEQLIFPFKLRKYKLDIMHFPHFNVPILYRRPYVVTIHDLILSLFPGQKMTKFYHRFAYQLIIKNAIKKAHKIIAVSVHTKNDIISHFQIPSEKIEVVYNGVSEHFYFLNNAQEAQKTLQKYHITKPFLLYTGVWRSHKNLQALIKAFDILQLEKNLDLQLVITGKPDPSFGKLDDQIITPGLVSEKELNHLYNAAMIFVFPSFYEGFGLPPLESMKCGTPVVASQNTSIPEVCGPENALYFDPTSAADLAEKVEKLYKDADLQAELIQKGVARATHFKWQNCAEKTWKILITPYV